MSDARKNCSVQPVLWTWPTLGRRQRIFSCPGSIDETFPDDSSSSRETNSGNMAADCISGFWQSREASGNPCANHRWL